MSLLDLLDRLNWVPRPYRLRFLLGERSLYVRSFRALVLKTHFLKIGATPDEVIGAIGSLDETVDVVVMDSIPTERIHPKISELSNWLVYCPKHFSRYYVDLTTSFEEYLSQFSSKTRSTLRRKVRKFQEYSGGSIDFREYKTAEEFEEFYPVALELSRQTYQHRLLDAGLPASSTFLSAARELALARQIRAYLLYHNSKPVAYLYCPISDGILTYAYLGYDRSLSEWSCGTVLQYLAFQRLFAEQAFRIFDFTQGEGEHKKLFSTGSTACAQVLCFRPTLRNKTLVLSHAALASVSRGIVRLLDRLAIKKQIKRLLRHG